MALVDNDGKGPDRLTADSIVVGAQKCPVDVIIFATGFRTPFTGTPAEKANLTITGPSNPQIDITWIDADLARVRSISQARAIFGFNLGGGSTSHQSFVFA